MDTLQGKGARAVWEGAQRTGPQGSTGLADGRLNGALFVPTAGTCVIPVAYLLSCVLSKRTHAHQPLGGSGQGVSLGADDEHSACPLSLWEVRADSRAQPLLPKP